jgi:hypothetical protein
MMTWQALSISPYQEATPGRLIKHLEDGDAAQRLRGCEVLVFDEADRQGHTSVHLLA